MSIKIKQRKPYLVKEVGEWKFTFHYKEGSIERTFLSITSTSGIFNCRVGGNTHAYGYLLAAANQDRLDQLQGYIVSLFIPAMAMTQDQELTSGVQKAIVEWQKRKEAEGAEKAKAVTDSEEMASQAFMESVVEHSQMSKKEAKAASDADKELMREVLNEKDNGE
jgi:hypothetical protein